MKNKAHVIMLAVLAISIIALFLSIKTAAETRAIDVTYEVGENAGFDVSGDSLTFGRIPPGSKATRSIRIDNPENVEVEVRFFHSRSLDGAISYNSEPIFVGAGQSFNQSFTITVPMGAAFGKYSGQVFARISK